MASSKKINKKQKVHPLISFCVATYKRPKFLKTTLESILNQSYENIEVVVSDNDPAGSAKKIVNLFKSKKIVYHNNRTNIGMAKNFNKALSLSSGEYITFITDDDPLEKNMLATLVNAMNKYPNCCSYFGASNLYTSDHKIAKIYGLQYGITSMRNKLIKKNAVRIFNPEEFINGFIDRSILPYFLWSTGITKREVIEKINGMPDYGSPYLTDFAFIINVGMQGNMLVINKELGRQTIHANNYGRTFEDLQLLRKGVKGFKRSIKKHINNDKYETQIDKFLSKWITDYLINIKRFNAKQPTNIDNSYLKIIYEKLRQDLPGLKSTKLEFNVRYISPNLGSTLFLYLSLLNFKKIKLLFDKYARS